MYTEGQPAGVFLLYLLTRHSPKMSSQPWLSESSVSLLALFPEKHHHL